ncbi:Myb-related protein Pp2 [Morus notabilis]|uniref:Myb-related protein Pp2 n=1 Tax=Morus notabilis TaxID=981085 RepID=W9QDY1_9ROSA|nr:transcription factor MYB35 [Morus notabilis]EXB29781.1 Myb-related protein Pp2 [Morus notabilis]
MVRPPCSDKPNVKWSAEEDAKILEHVSKRAGLRRCGKSCKLRWTNNHLRPDLIKHDQISFTPKEEELIIKLHATIGSRWPLIAQQLPGRTDEDVKNYWNTKLRKKLSGMGIDPVTHKPYSQILADYGNIGGVPKSGMRIGSLNKDLKNAILMKREAFSTPNTKPNLVSPKTEPNQDSNFLNHRNQSLDLLAQLQAIKLVTEASNYPPPGLISKEPAFSFSFAFSPSSSPVSSSSDYSTCSSAAQELPPLAFNWNDFLLEDAFLPSDEAQGDAKVAEFSPRNLVPESHIHTTSQDVEGPKDGAGDHTVLSNDHEVNETSSCETSFVEALLARENEMLLEFPELLEEAFY